METTIGFRVYGLEGMEKKIETMIMGYKVDLPK